MRWGSLHSPICTPDPRGAEHVSHQAGMFQAGATKIRREMQWRVIKVTLHAHHITSRLHTADFTWIATDNHRGCSRGYSTHHHRPNSHLFQ